MPSLTGFNIRCTPSWQMSIFAICMILLFIRLGFWQLHRAEEKINMVNAHSALADQKPILWQEGSTLPAQYQQFRVQGQFLQKTLLLDNQHYHHQFGYHAVSPFVLSNGNVILIDRGWLPGDPTRQIFPPVESPRNIITLQGSAYYPSEKNWQLGQVFENDSANYVVIELIDTKLISQFLHKSVYPFIMRLGKDEANGYIREWTVVAMPPKRHYAYAVQWFAMALVILIIFIVLNCKKKHETHSY